MPSSVRLGDHAECPGDAHGCPGCPHPSRGPAVSGSRDVFIEGRPALRRGDQGIHGPCCGSGTWIALTGSPTVFINGRPACRVGDAVRFCGGAGRFAARRGSVLLDEAQSAADPQPELMLTITVNEKEYFPNTRDPRPLKDARVTIDGQAELRTGADGSVTSWVSRGTHQIDVRPPCEHLGRFVESRSVDVQDHRSEAVTIPNATLAIRLVDEYVTPPSKDQPALLLDQRPLRGCRVAVVCKGARGPTAKQTDEHGVVTFDLPEGPWQLRVTHKRLRLGTCSPYLTDTDVTLVSLRLPTIKEAADKIPIGAKVKWEQEGHYQELAKREFNLAVCYLSLDHAKLADVGDDGWAPFAQLLEPYRVPDGPGLRPEVVEDVKDVIGDATQIPNPSIDPEGFTRMFLERLKAQFPDFLKNCPQFVHRNAQFFLEHVLELYQKNPWTPTDDLPRAQWKGWQGQRMGTFLLWPSEGNNPAWLNDCIKLMKTLNLSPVQRRTMLRGVFDAYIPWAMTTLDIEASWWVVVNEPLKPPPKPRKRSWPWRAWDPFFIPDEHENFELLVDVFGCAHSADHSALLLLNDFDVEVYRTPKARRFRERALALRERLKDRSCFGVGLQMHIGNNRATRLPWKRYCEELDQTLRFFEKEKIPFVITELTVEKSAKGDKRTWFREVLTRCLASKQFRAAALWGVTDEDLRTKVTKDDKEVILEEFKEGAIFYDSLGRKDGYFGVMDALCSVNKRHRLPLMSV